MSDLIDKAEALLPCPFCGGEATFSEGKTGDGKPWHYVECSDCEAMGPGVSYADHNIAVKSALAGAWNRRAALPARGVGVKPPFYFDRYINGVRMAEDVCVERETTLESAMLVAARIAAKGPKGEAPVLVYRAPTDAAQAREAAIRELRHRWYLGDLEEKDFTAALKGADHE